MCAIASVRVAGLGPRPSFRISSTAFLFQSVTTSARALSGSALSRAKAERANVRRMPGDLRRSPNQRKTNVSYQRRSPDPSAHGHEEAAETLTPSRIADHRPNSHDASRGGSSPCVFRSALVVLGFLSARHCILEMSCSREPRDAHRFVPRLDDE